MTQIQTEPQANNSAAAAQNPAAGARVATTELIREVVKTSPFTEWTGCEVIRCEAGVAELQMPYRKDLTQHHGFIHGGVIGFLSDNVSAWAAASVVGDVVTADYSVKLLSPGIGEAFYARGEVVKANKRLVAVESRVYAINEGKRKLVAMGTATILPV
ncbi:MAG: PaaI family thioesterase [Alphaproteobacteria bacterium]|nr:PaaI family thioesterase [Alphaproteobacteria bacterium]